MMRFKAFILGMLEFRSLVTTGYYDKQGNALIQQIWYDWGREFAHRVTFRKWDENA